MTIDHDRGEIAFTAYFTDGSQGIFIATIPEPPAAALISLTLAAASSRRRLICNGTVQPGT